MNIKKSLAVVVALCALLTAFVGCSKNETKPEDEATTEETPVAEETKDAEEAETEEDAPAETAEYKDGEYEVVLDAESAENGHGWADFIKATVKDGKIESIEFNTKDADGKLKSEATAEEYPMTPAPSEWIPEINAQLKEAATPEDIAGVAGATHTSDSVKTLYGKLIENMEAGTTGTTEINTVTAEDAE